MHQVGRHATPFHSTPVSCFDRHAYRSIGDDGAGPVQPATTRKKCRRGAAGLATLGQDAAADEELAPAGELDALFFVAPGECARKPIEFVPAGKHADTLNVPDSAIDVYGDEVKNGKLDMPYGEIQNGGAYCVDAGSGKDTIIVGGTFMFETKDGTCVAPPQTAAGQPCCEIFMWQPNSGGYYYDNCSMKCDLRLPIYVDEYRLLVCAPGWDMRILAARYPTAPVGAAQSYSPIRILFFSNYLSFCFKSPAACASTCTACPQHPTQPGRHAEASLGRCVCS